MYPLHMYIIVCNLYVNKTDMYKEKIMIANIFNFFMSIKFSTYFKIFSLK